MTITAIVLAQNEESMIKECLDSLGFCDEIILIDSGSKDKTVKIAQEYNAHIFEELSSDFSAKRNLGLQKATTDWVFYVDADERVSDELVASIKKQVVSYEDSASVLKIRRKNFYLGEHAWPQVEEMERLFRKDSLKKWQGALHESPVYTGEVDVLDGELLHYTHRELAEMVAKTNQWSETEAKLRVEAAHPPMYWWRFPRVMSQAFFASYIIQGGWKIGTPGLIESLYQSFSMFITYAKLWELQQSSRHKQ